MKFSKYSDPITFCPPGGVPGGASFHLPLPTSLQPSASSHQPPAVSLLPSASCHQATTLDYYPSTTTLNGDLKHLFPTTALNNYPHQLHSTTSFDCYLQKLPSTTTFNNERESPAGSHRPSLICALLTKSNVIININIHNVF